MLYIEKKRPSQATQRDLSRIKSLPSWGRIIEGDTKALRQHFDLLDKSIVRNDLLEEQHSLCAYCMRRIHDGSTSIEHYIPLSKSKNSALDYNNFLAVCDGGSSVIVADKRVLCCDQNKGNVDELTIDPRNETMMRGISYTPEGKIIFVNPSSYDDAMLAKINEDINVTLRLNGMLDEKGNCKGEEIQAFAKELTVGDEFNPKTIKTSDNVLFDLDENNPGESLMTELENKKKEAIAKLTDVNSDINSITYQELQNGELVDVVLEASKYIENGISVLERRAIYK